MANLGIELELAVLLAFSVLGSELFAAFEVETPGWKKVLKWAVVIAITLGSYPFIGHWSVLIIVFFGGLGTVFHFVWCSKNDIHPFKATPRRRYYELRGWDWPD